MSDSFGSSIEGLNPQPEIKKNVNTVKIYFMHKVLLMKSRYRRITKLINKEGRRYLISHDWRYPKNENKYTYRLLHHVSCI